jgi:hypothetical protein
LFTIGLGFFTTDIQLFIMHYGKRMLLAFFGFGGAARLGVRFEIVGCPFTFEFGNKG